MYFIQATILQKLPSACPLCGLTARGGNLCSGCAQDFVWRLNGLQSCVRCLNPVPKQTTSETPATADDTLQAAQCSRCRRDAPPYVRLVAAMDYAYPTAMLIQRFKEGARLTYAGLFARVLWTRLRAQSPGDPGLLPLGALVPIPSSQQALRRRGYNPAGELALELARLSGYPLQREWLRRTRETPSQTMLDAAARRESVQGLYVCPHALPRVWVGLVDDVVTTGSTMQTAACALLNAGAAGVVALAAANTPARLAR